MEFISAARLSVLIKVVIENGLGLEAENLQPSNFEMIGKVHTTVFYHILPAHEDK